MMTVEVKLISQMQAVQAMISSDCNTLHMDGTKKSGLEYGCVQVSTDSGQYNLGFSKLVCDDTFF